MENVRNLERAGVPRSVAMKLTGPEAVYRRYAIVCEADLSEGIKKLARLTDFSHSLATVLAKKPQNAEENMAEGARFELADPLRGLRFSRPARSATPSPLHTLLAPTGSLYDSSWRPDKIPSVLFVSYSLLIRSMPPIYGRRASGTTTDPSGC